MATFENYKTRTYLAGENLTQFRFVTLEADGNVDLADAAGETCVGVVINDPSTGGAATVAYEGRVLVETGTGGVTRGGAVATDASGKVVDATSGDIILGYARETGVAGQIVAIDFFLGGNAN